MTMRPLLAISLALALALGSGCFYPEGWSRGAHSAAYKVDAVLVVTGLVIAALPCPSPNGLDDDTDCHSLRMALAGVWAVPGAFGALLNALVRDWSPEPEQVGAGAPPPGDGPPGATPSDMHVPPHEGELGDLAVRAAIAARVGRCDSARAAMRTIFEREPQYFEEVVAREPAILACLH